MMEPMTIATMAGHLENLVRSVSREWVDRGVCHGCLVGSMGTYLQYALDMQPSQVVKVVLTSFAAFWTEFWLGTEAVLGIELESGMPVGSAVGTAVGRPAGTEAGKPVGTAVGMVCLATREAMAGDKYGSSFMTAEPRVGGRWPWSPSRGGNAGGLPGSKTARHKEVQR